MMKKKYLFLILVLISCSSDDLIKTTTKNYIDFLVNETETDFNVFVHKTRFKDKIIYRINSGTFNLKPGEIPSRFYEYKQHYVFIFSEISISLKKREVLKNKGLYETKERIYIEEDYDEWLLVLCSEKHYKLIKDSWYRPYDQLKSIQLFKCD